MVEPMRQPKVFAPETFRARVVTIVFFLVVLSVGLSVHGDYGVSFDEPQQRLIGLVNLKYVLERCAPAWLTDALRPVPSLEGFSDRDYGALFELVSAVVEALLTLDEPSIFRVRHLLTFLVFFVGVIAVHALARRRFADWRLALLPCLFLVLTPRFFAEGFYNSKDIVFMALFAVALNSLIGFVLRPSPRMALVHALASSIAIDVRIVAIILPGATAVISLARAFRRETGWRITFLSLAMYLVATCALVPLMWPSLWSDPIAEFGSALQSAAHFRWDFQTLYRGAFVRADQLPWHYIPLWITITTPVLYLGLFLVGALAILWRSARLGVRAWSNEHELQDLILLIMFVASVAMVIALGSVVYDGWRHLYFIYPSFLLVAVRGFSVFLKTGPWQRARQSVLVAASVATLMATMVWMWRVHPFQNVYFNLLAGDDLRSNFELDYWGLANKTALERILEEDRRETVSVRADSWTPLEVAFQAIAPDQKKRLKYLRYPALSDYVFNNYRALSPPYDAKTLENYDLFFEVHAGDLAILSVYRRKVLP